MYERCHRGCHRARQRRQLLELLRKRGAAVRDTSRGREAITDVVCMLASPPRETQMLAAALLARLADGADGDASDA